MSERAPEYRQTALDQLRAVNAQNIGQVHATIIGNRFVQEAKCFPTVQQVADFFQRSLRGVQYAQDTWGDDALPSGIMLMQGELLSVPLEHHGRREFIGYDAEDDFIKISALHIARQSAHPDGLFKDSHLPADKRVKMADHTTLQFIEECYHRYDIKALGSPPADTALDRDHPLERAIQDVYAKAIPALGISLIDAPKR